MTFSIAATLKFNCISQLYVSVFQKSLFVLANKMQQENPVMVTWN